MSSNSQDIDILKELEKVNQDLQGKIRQDPKFMQSVTKPKVGFTDFRKLLDETNQSVRPIVEAFCESYVTNENMLDIKVQQRLNIDSIALSEILWKKAVSDVAVIQIMERIDSGDDDYKMYASLSSILGTKTNFSKELLQTIMVLEKNYKDLKSELFEQNKLSIENTENVSSESLKFRGTKNLLMAIRNVNEIEESRKILEGETQVEENTEQEISIVKMKYTEEINDEEQNPKNPL
jgi:hypothetical protein